MASTFFVYTLGCKVNQSESDTLEHCLKQAGWNPAGKEEPADVFIVNTCAVTGRAAQQSRQQVRRLLREYPNARVIATGCGVEFEPDAYRRLDGAPLVVRQDEKHRLSEIVRSDGMNHPAGSVFPEDGPPLPIGGGRTRPFLKIQDGCNASCAYCIVPKLRGRSRSMPAAEVMDRLRLIGQAGFHEVVLTGVHLGHWGRDLSPPDCLLNLMRRMAASPPIERVRLSSIEPLELYEEMVALVSLKSLFCDHFHIPLQNGSDRILNAMGRPYTTLEFEQRVRWIRNRMPHAAIGTDVLIGFPGEDENCFRKTVDFIRSLPFTYLHVFPFSARPGSRASEIHDRIPDPVIRERCHQLRNIGHEKKKEFYRSFVGNQVRLLIEETRDPDTADLKGLTTNYIPVLIRGDDDLRNTFVDCVIEGVDEDAVVRGRVIR